MRTAIREQAEHLRAVPTGERLPPDARVVYTGCGTSFHAAMTGGAAVQALEAVLEPPAADVLVCVSHEGTTPLTLEAAEAFPGRVWAVTAVENPLSAAAEHVVWTPAPPEQSWCHTRSYTCAIATLAALRGEDVAWLPDAGSSRARVATTRRRSRRR
jgi:fructoselysine-6-P-deglycase FrlB-like protein